MQFRSAGPSGGPQSAGRDRGVRIPAYGYDVLGAERLSAGRVRHAVDLFQRHGGRQDRRTHPPAVHAVESPRAPFHNGDDGLCSGTAKEETEIQAEKTDEKEEQEIIDRAKEILAERNGMTEEEAHHYLQKCSMDGGNTLQETAQMILSMLDI